MAAWFGSVLKFLAGKKTYILSVLVVLVTLILVAIGKLTPETAMAVLLFALGLFAATFRSALAEHQQQTLAVLLQAAAFGLAVRSKNSTAIIAAGAALVQDGAALDQACQDHPLVPVNDPIPLPPAGSPGPIGPMVEVSR